MNTPGNADWMPDFEDPEKPNTPRMVSVTRYTQTGPGEYSSYDHPQILWAEFGDFCLISNVGADTPHVIHKRIIKDQPKSTL